MQLLFRKLWVLLLLLFFPYMLVGQENNSRNIKGKVIEDHEGHLHPLPGASVYWLGTSTGTATNEEGEFKLKRIPDNSLLVISFIGFKTDTIDIMLRVPHFHKSIKFQI